MSAVRTVRSSWIFTGRHVPIIGYRKLCSRRLHYPRRPTVSGVLQVRVVPPSDRRRWGLDYKEIALRRCLLCGLVRLCRCRRSRPFSPAAADGGDSPTWVPPSRPFVSWRLRRCWIDLRLPRRPTTATSSTTTSACGEIGAAALSSFSSLYFFPIPCLQS